jgi:tRNA pseudouridine38-40 synthase
MKKKGDRLRYRLTLEYDGTNFSGWQKQADARTVQGDLLKAAERVFDEIVIDLQGCGRTDAGVHALEYVAHLDVASDRPPHEVAWMFNETLPRDIAVWAVGVADPRFHARHNCIARSYLYQLRTQKSAFGKRYDWWVHTDLDLPAMQRAGAMMVGMHDYAAFAEKQELKKSTRVLVHKVGVSVEKDKILIQVIGSHFLWHMVRRMVGVLVEVGRHRLNEEDIPGLFQGPSEVPINHTAPAAGLFFQKAFYDGEELARVLKEEFPHSFNICPARSFPGTTG